MFEEVFSNVTTTNAFMEEPTLSWEERVAQFQAFERKTAEAVLAMGKIVFEAKQDLPATDFERFIAGTHLKGSTERKYECIGRYEGTLARFVDRLPATWTSLYELTKIGEQKLEEVLADGRVWPQMTGKDIKDLLDSLGVGCSIRNKEPKPAAAPSNEGYTLSIRFARTPASETLLQLEELIRKFIDQNELSADLSLSELLTGLIDQATRPQVEEVEPC